MKFRPCIDIHNGQVKQIVGGSLQDAGDKANENFVSDMSAKDYALLYQRHNRNGGHIILLNGKDSPYFEADVEQAEQALGAYPGGLQIGGGVTAENAKKYICMGASHVIVTSYVFDSGRVHYDRLEALRKTVGKEHIVLDLSCRKKDDSYYIVTNRWQTFTSECISRELFERLSEYCDEFLVHAVDVEGKRSGVDQDLIELLAAYCNKPITYAGGIHSDEDLEQIKQAGKGKIDFTIGSALDLFGGKMEYQRIITEY